MVPEPSQGNDHNNIAQKKLNAPAAALISGAIAGSVEGFITYPTEFVKTRSQFRFDALSTNQKPPGPIQILKSTVSKDGIKGLYSGCSALVLGNGLKAGVRFFSYDKFKKLLVDDQGKLTGPRSLLAGLGAGMLEAIIAVTPSETIKTKLVNESLKPNPRFNGLVSGTREIIRLEGLSGIYRGLFPVMMRQGANSAVRFSTYSSLKSLFQGNMSSGQQLPGLITFGIGGIAGIVTVYCTMPLDVIKTRMQSLEAKSKYRNSFDCANQIFKYEGITRFWKGTTPRLVRLSLSGGIVFTVYENVIKLLGGKSI
ncbi:tricarboxylate transporter [Phakopsora pachyrhizi]|uniref:Tricarboxylate transporter n=2 Tax=Phakopsora pachyrhizi TaxID=170000 RepID=A0AAV0AWA6_PHAPC|nr:tricarboxylate transporter [Phakopsora pachyrhizi]CAH7673466.1 tricarboxylate transporter [Phakopsora pachyrhizi]